MRIALCGYSGAWRLDAVPDPQDCLSTWIQSREDLEGLAAGVDPILFPEELPPLLQEWDELGYLPGWEFHHGECAGGALCVVRVPDGYRIKFEPGCGHWDAHDEPLVEAQQGNFHSFRATRFHWVVDDVRFWAFVPSLEGLTMDEVFDLSQAHSGILPFVEADSHFRALCLEEEGQNCTCYVCRHDARAQLAREPEWIGYPYEQEPRAVGLYCENCAWEVIYRD